MVVVNFDITFVMNCTVSKHLVPEKSSLLIIFKRDAITLRKLVILIVITNVFHFVSRRKDEVCFDYFFVISQIDEKNNKYHCVVVP